MKMEHFIYIRRRMTGIRRLGSRATQNMSTLHKRGSQSSHRMTPVDSLDGKLGLGFRRQNDEIGLVSVVAHSETHNAHKERKSLEEYLGPMFIRVQHDVEWSVEQS